MGVPQERQAPADFFRITAISAMICLSLNTQIWPVAARLYEGDSFHTLSAWSAFGLAVLSVILVLILWSLSWSLTRYLRGRKDNKPGVVVTLDMIFTVGTYWLLLSISPQIFYSYYQQIFPGLPVQWVVSGMLPLAEFLTLLQLSPDDSLASHSAGFAGLVLISNKVLQWIR